MSQSVRFVRPGNLSLPIITRCDIMTPFLSFVPLPKYLRTAGSRIIGHMRRTSHSIDTRRGGEVEAILNLTNPTWCRNLPPIDIDG